MNKCALGVNTKNSQRDSHDNSHEEPMHRYAVISQGRANSDAYQCANALPLVGQSLWAPHGPFIMWHVVPRSTHIARHRQATALDFLLLGLWMRMLLLRAVHRRLSLLCVHLLGILLVILLSVVQQLLMLLQGDPGCRLQLCLKWVDCHCCHFAQPAHTDTLERNVHK